MFKPTYLYIKEHSLTGLRYFGKTTVDPYEYKGSGKHWVRHINKHGRQHVITLWVSELFTNRDALVKYATFLSEELDIVNSDKWANLSIETGIAGGNTMLNKTHSKETKQLMSNAKKGKLHSAEHNIKIGISRAGKKHTEESKQKMSDAKKGKAYRKGKSHSEETKRKMSESLKLKYKLLKDEYGGH